jgi:phosphinothricin acetyltransferase
MDTIRLATADDGAALAAIYAPSVTHAATSFEVDPPGAGEMARRVAAVLAHAPWLVLERGGAVAGYAYASRHHERVAYQWSVDVTVYIDRAHHRTGVGRTLYTALFALLRVQGFYVAHAGVTLPNDASVGLHESFGFTPVGVYRDVGYKLGAWYDVGWWRLALRAPDPAPAPPRSMAEVMDDPLWRAAIAG